MDNEKCLIDQLIKLGDMIGEGLHREPGGEFIKRDYNLILKALNIPNNLKRNPDEINNAMKERIRDTTCLICGGRLIQTRSGSMTAKCIICNSKFKLLRRVRVKK